MASMSTIAAFSRQFAGISAKQQQPCEVCLGCTLPPAAAIASAQTFDGILNVAERFRTIREENQRGTMVAKQLQSQQPKPRSSSSSSFITCLLHVIHPMSRLMAHADMMRMQTRYIETQRATVVQCAHSIAQEYHTHVLKKTANPTVDAVRDSIVRDPSRAFTDEGLNHAVVFYLTQRMDVAIVMRPGPPGTACLTFLPAGKTASPPSTLPCVLITRETETSDSEYRIEHDGPLMADVWAHLRSHPTVDAHIREAAPLGDRLTVPAIHRIAAMVGMGIGGQGPAGPRATAAAFGGKAGLLRAVFVDLSPSPSSTAFRLFQTS